MTELAHFLRDLDDHDDVMEKLTKEWTFAAEVGKVREQFATFFPNAANELSASSKPHTLETVENLDDDSNLDSLLATPSSQEDKGGKGTFYSKFELSMYVHEVSKLILHHKDVNKLYTNMKHEYLSYNNLSDDKLPAVTTGPANNNNSSAGGAAAPGPMDTTQHKNNILDEIVSIAYDNTMYHLFPHLNAQYQVRHRPDFLFDHQHQQACYDVYLAKKENIVKEIINFHRDLSPILNDIYCYPHAPATSTDVNAAKEKINKSFEEFVLEHPSIQELYNKLFVESYSGKAKDAMPPHALEMSKTFYQALLHNIRVVIYSLPRQRKTFAYNPMSCDLAKVLPNENTFPTAVSKDEPATTQVKKEHEFDVVFVNSRHLLASARLYNTNANRLMKNAKDRDVYYDAKRYADRGGEVKEEDDTHNYIAYTRDYNNTVVQECENIQVSHRMKHTVPQYIRTCSIHFNESKKKNDVNTSSVLRDNTFLYSTLFARYARENVNPTLYRNILTSKKLGLNYYTSDPYVVLGLYTLFMNEVMKYPSYLLIHAMILDLMDGSSSGTNSATASLSSASGDMAGKGLARPSSMSASFYGGAVGGPPSSAPKLNWLKLVPRKRLEGPVVVGGGESSEKAPVERDEKVMRLLYNYMKDDVYIPIAIENYEEGNKELLALYNACTSLPYLYDDECKVAGDRPRVRKSTWDMKELMINKENQIMNEWFAYRGINFQPPSYSTDAKQAAYYYQKVLLPKLNELSMKWYGLNLYDSFEQLKL